MSVHDGVDVGILGVLRGAPLAPGIAKHNALAGMVLGVGIGAHVDAGLSDEDILRNCAEVLRLIRAAMQAPDPVGEAFKAAIAKRPL